MGCKQRVAWLMLWGLDFLQAAAAPGGPGPQIAAFAGPGGLRARSALRPGSALCRRARVPGAPQPGPAPGATRGAPLPGAGARGSRTVACALVQGGEEQAQADREVAPPEFKDTIYAQSTAVGMVRHPGFARRARAAPRRSFV